MQQTTNYNLNKFDSTDALESATRVGLNENADIIDGALTGLSEATGISYDNTESGLIAETVQGAIDEISQPATTTTAGLMSASDKEKLDEAIDYIVEQGTEGIWTYRKWNSGIAECWGTLQCEITGWNAWGSLYEAASSTRYATFPTGLFNVPPVCVASHEGNGLGAFLETYMSATVERTPTYIHIRPSSASATTLGINIYAKGTWK